MVYIRRNFNGRNNRTVFVVLVSSVYIFLLFRYSIASNTWTPVGKLNFARSAITAIVLTGIQNIEDYLSTGTLSNNSDRSGVLKNDYVVEESLDRKEHNG